MNNCQILSRVFTALTLLLTHTACAATAYSYSGLQHCTGCSAPVSTAFLLLIPYGAGAALCALLAWHFHRKHRKTT